MTWGSDCSMCGKEKCNWVKGRFCEGGLDMQVATAITEAVGAERAAILDWAKNYYTQILTSPREGEFMNGLISASGTVVKAIEARAEKPVAADVEGET